MWMIRRQLRKKLWFALPESGPDPTSAGPRQDSYTWPSPTETYPWPMSRHGRAVDDLSEKVKSSSDSRPQVLRPLSRDVNPWWLSRHLLRSGLRGRGVGVSDTGRLTYQDSTLSLQSGLQSLGPLWHLIDDSRQEGVEETLREDVESRGKEIPFRLWNRHSGIKKNQGEWWSLGNETHYSKNTRLWRKMDEDTEVIYRITTWIPVDYLRTSVRPPLSLPTFLFPRIGWCKDKDVGCIVPELFTNHLLAHSGREE